MIQNKTVTLTIQAVMLRWKLAKRTVNNLVMAVKRAVQIPVMTANPNVSKETKAVLLGARSSGLSAEEAA